MASPLCPRTPTCAVAYAPPDSTLRGHRWRESDVLIDDHERQLAGRGDVAGDATASAQIVDERGQRGVEREVVGVRTPRVAVGLVGEAVRLPRDREPQLVPRVLRHAEVAGAHPHASVSLEGELHAGP